VLKASPAAKSGTAPDYNYKRGQQEGRDTWHAETFTEYIANPMPDSGHPKMAFAGPQERFFKEGIADTGGLLKKFKADGSK